MDAHGDDDDDDGSVAWSPSGVWLGSTSGAASPGVEQLAELVGTAAIDDPSMKEAWAKQSSSMFSK
eukprot:5733179-Prymnesium_polylepis.1